MVVHDYNTHMMGVDRLDQLTSYYCFLRKSVKWWRKVFFWLTEVAVVNSYILYKNTPHQAGHTTIPHLEFRRQLIVALCSPLCSIPRPRSGRRNQDQSLERLRPGNHFIARGRKRKDCRVCSKRREGQTRRLTPYFCSTCSDNPPLCPGDCFQRYHTRRSYTTN